MSVVASERALSSQIVDGIRSVVGPAPAVLHEPQFAGNEWEYLKECLDSVQRQSDWTNRRGKLPFGKGQGVACSMYISGTAYPVYPNDMPQSGVMLRDLN